MEQIWVIVLFYVGIVLNNYYFVLEYLYQRNFLSFKYKTGKNKFEFKSKILTKILYKVKEDNKKVNLIYLTNFLLRF